MPDDLIGFVMGALDPAEHEEVRRRVEQSERLQEQVRLVRRSLEPLQNWGEEQEPPHGLAERTCRLVTAVSGGGSLTDGALSFTEDQERAASSALLESVAEPSELPATANVEPANVELAGQVRRNWVAGGRESLSGQRQWTLADFVVAAGVCLAASCLFFPALINSRYHWQLASCQNNMRQVGQGLIQYSGEQGGYFPSPAASGPYAAAGIYGPQLVHRQLVPDGRVFLCPAKGNTYVLRVPDLSELGAAKGIQLVRLQKKMGGDYAYLLGYVENGRLQRVKNRGQRHGAILADAPLENLRTVSIGTHGKGQNVLFEDGHVCFLATRQRPGDPQDDIFFNQLGYQRAGLGANDVVLGASHVRPLPFDYNEAELEAGAAGAEAGAKVVPPTP